MEHLSNDHKDRPDQHENGNTLCNETGHPVGKSMETETTTLSEFRISKWWESHCRTDTSIRRKK